MALCVVACATYQEAPTPLGDDESVAGSAVTPSGGSGNAGTAPTGGTTVVSQAGTATSPSAGTATVVAGSSGSGTVVPSGGNSGTGGVTGSAGTAVVGDGGAGGEPPAVVDECPTDPAKTAPGVCGCGFPDADTATLASCTGLKTSLVHRYDFEGTGTVVTDRVGTAHGSVKGGASLSKLSGKGVVVLNGGTAGSYVDLPNGLLSALTSATLEAWVTWGGGNAWQRIFDFGDSTNATPEDNPANGKSYLFLTPMDAATGGFMRAVYSLTGGAVAAETRLEATQVLPQTLAQVAVVVDATGGKLILYLNGVKDSEQAYAGDLGSINDVNAWLGRSQYNADPEMTGTFHDFRMYKAALTPLQIATSFAGGADPAFLAK
jgi:Concanavalin A-like lectin/glucanases superfamily